MVAVPTLLLNEAQVRDLVLDLEIRFLANRDPNLYFALLTDSPDSDRPVDERDALVDVCRELIEGLNRALSRGSPVLPVPPAPRLQRLGRPLDGLGAQARQTARPEPPDARRLRRVPGEGGRPRRAAAHALRDHARFRHAAAARLGREADRRDRASAESRRWWTRHARWSSRATAFCSRASASAFNRRRAAAWRRSIPGETGFDIYTRAVSDVYQDLFGEGIFTGKGIYEVDAMRDVLEHRFPENALLSHDLIEGAYARVALVSDIELIDDYPSHFSAYNRRKHRWVRGDWQILRWIQSRVPDFHGNLIAESDLADLAVEDRRQSAAQPARARPAAAAAGRLVLCCRARPDIGRRRPSRCCSCRSTATCSFALLRVPFAAGARLPRGLRRPARAFADGHAIALLQPDLPAAPGAALAGRDHRARSCASSSPSASCWNGRRRPKPKRPRAAKRPWTSIWSGRRGIARAAGAAGLGCCARPRCRPPPRCSSCGRRRARSRRG